MFKENPQNHQTKPIQPHQSVATYRIELDTEYSKLNRIVGTSSDKSFYPTMEAGHELLWKKSQFWKFENITTIRVQCTHKIKLW